MSTSRKDYIAIAAVLKQTKDGYQPHWDANLFRAHSDTCCAIANYFASQNPRFDKQRFLRAAGVL